MRSSYSGNIGSPIYYVSSLYHNQQCRVMMQTVLANTKNPVKFWFLKNYLSPKFINSIPTIAKELGCEVNFIPIFSYLYHLFQLLGSAHLRFVYLTTGAGVVCYLKTNRLCVDLECGYHLSTMYIIIH